MGMDLGVELQVGLGATLQGTHLLHTRSLFLENFMKSIKEQRQYVGDIIYRKGESSNRRKGGHSAFYFAKKEYVGAVTLGIGELPQLKAGKIDKKKQKNCY